MLRGFVRQIRMWPAKKQMPLLIAAGVAERAIYSGDEEWDACIKSLRAGDKLVVAGGQSIRSAIAAPR